MSRYISKPQIIEAIQYGPTFNAGLVDEVAVFIAGRPLTSEGEVIDFVRPNVPWDPPDPNYSTIEIRAGKDGAQGWVPVPIGHWIVRSAGDLTDHWPVDPDYFANKYEPYTIVHADDYFSSETP